MVRPASGPPTGVVVEVGFWVGAPRAARNEAIAKLSGVSARTVQNIERGVSPGTLQTMDRILGVLGLRLGVVAVAPAPAQRTAQLA